MADVLERIAVNLGKANEALQAIETRLECEAVEVAVAVARKLVPTLIAREPFAEIATLASDCFRELVSSPHIAVRVNDAVYATAKEKLDDIARARTFEGRLVVLAEPEVALGDCRIEWADGGINRDSASANTVIGEAVTGYIGARRNFAGLEPHRSAPEMQETPMRETPSPVSDRQDTRGNRASAHDLLMTNENEFRRSDNE
jgi:flagellar assembly protein FliH